MRLLQWYRLSKGSLLQWPYMFYCFHTILFQFLGLPGDLLKALSKTLGSLVINIKEFLLTENSENRKVILQVKEFFGK